jgi:hypothetical protein
MVRRRVEELIQMRADDAVQHAAFGVARLVRGAEHARDIRTARRREQCRKGDTSDRLGSERAAMLWGQVSTFADAGIVEDTRGAYVI